LNISDIVIHISETLDDSGIHGLQREIGEENGVYSACMHEKTRHLMVVDFDPMEVRPTAVPLMRTSVKMLSEVAVDQPSICAAADQAGAAGTGSFATI